MALRPYGWGWRSAQRDMERLRREMNRLFTEWPTRPGWSAASGFPAMNVWTDENNAVVTAELAGINPEDIDISVVGDTLTLSGNRPADELEDGERFHRRERSYGKFNRSFKLPFRIETDQIEASFDKGVLHISVPRSEADKPKKINVKSA